MPAVEPVPPRAVGRSPRWLLLTAFSLVLGAIAFGLLRAGALPVVPDVTLLRQLTPSAWLSFSALWLFALTLRCYRWRFQLEPLAAISTARVLAVGFVGNAALIAFPLRSGEFVRPLLIARGGRVPFLSALATIGCERLLDSLFAASLLVFSLLEAPTRVPLPDRIGELPVPAALIPRLGYSAGVFTLAAIALVLAFFYFRTATVGFLVRITRGVSTRIAPWLEARLDEITSGLVFLRDAKNAPRYLLMTACYWFTHLLAILLLARTCGFSDCSLAQAGVLLGTLSYATTLPSAPGFFGVFQIAVYAGLALFYPTVQVQSSGALLAFVLYVLELGWILALAPFAFWFERRTR